MGPLYRNRQEEETYVNFLFFWGEGGNKISEIKNSLIIRESK